MLFLSLRELSKRLVFELSLAGFASQEKILFSFPDTGADVLRKIPRSVFDFLLLLMSGLLSDPAVDFFLVDWTQEPEDRDAPGLSVSIRLTLKNAGVYFNPQQFQETYSLKRHLDKIQGKVTSLDPTGVILRFPLAQEESGFPKPLHMEKLLVEVGDPELCRELIEGFISHTGDLLRELKEKLECGDSAGVHRIAHSLKGSALNIFADGLRSAAAELEIQARGGILKNGNEYLEKIRREYTAITQYFEKDTIKKRILYAEDEFTSRKLMEYQLKKYGFHCDIAGNGREALEKFKNASYDLILLDFHMPGMDGADVAKVIRTLSPSTPLIAVTSDPQAVERLRAAGFQEILMKPLRGEGHIAIIQKYLT
jgi:CheY-like chemotaxis protein